MRFVIVCGSFFKPKTPAFLKGVDFVVWVWVAVAVAAIVIEAASAQLISVWFALGAFGSFVAALAGANVTVQIIIFFALSVVALIIMLPLVKKITKKETVKTNADRYIGKTAVVTEKISNINAQGQVKVDNQVWTARSENNADIEQGAQVKVLKIEGVKLIVSEIK